MKQRATNAGAALYRLNKRLQQQEARFQKLLENAPPYMGQTELWIVDQLTNYYTRTQRAKADVDDTAEELRETEKDVLAMMDYLELPPDYKLTAKLPGQAIFEIWYDEQRMVHCSWAEIEPEPENPNIIYIKMSDYDDMPTKKTKKKGVVEEKEDDDDDDIDDDTLIANIKKLYDVHGQPIKRLPEELNIVPEYVQYPNGRDESVYNLWDPNKDYTCF
jgi:hypothetical protein